MTWNVRRGVAGALLAVPSLLGGCAPERDVVASELALGGSGQGGSAGAGGTTTLSGPCATLLADPAPALVWFDFEDARGATVVRDRLAGRPATVVGTAASAVPGPEGCGTALGFGNDERWLRLDDDPAWNLMQGSIDAWFWVPSAISDVMGIISRDQYGDQVGHFSVFLLRDRTVMARLQQSAVGAPTPLVTLGCSSEPLPAASWAHFGFNFGPAGAALYVNGKPAMRTGPPALSVGMVKCGDAAPEPHIPDLPLPWVMGASIYASMDPPNERELPFLNGALDNLRISAVERDFASAF